LTSSGREPVAVLRISSGPHEVLYGQKSASTFARGPDVGFVLRGLFKSVELGLALGDRFSRNRPRNGKVGSGGLKDSRVAAADPPLSMFQPQSVHLRQLNQ